MLFPTFEFGLFFLIVFAVSWELRRELSLRKLFLVAASYFFYGWWDWRFLALLALSSLINFAAGWLVGRTQTPLSQKLTVGIAVTLNLCILGFFKYYGFFLESLDDAMAALGLARDLPFLHVILPVGVSFFTFQGISYVVDVYRGHVKASHSILNVFLYISFFPQLVAGPIVRAAHFLPQLDETPRLTRAMVGMGTVLILTGLLKKMVIANYLATQLVDPVFFDPSTRGAGDLLIGVYGYAVQIYCDFSGYSDIAIGIAALLGYRFTANFNQPYRSASLQDFWRRWHISLSSWLRDYLYIPLGGSRKGPIATYRNLFLTMFLGGLWHGAAWTFVVWGTLHGTMLGIERYLTRRLNAFAPKDDGTPSIIERLSGSTMHLVGIIWTFHFVCLAWIFFRAESIALAWDYIKGFANWTTPNELVTPFLVTLIAVTLLFQFTPSRLGRWLAEGIKEFPSPMLGAILGFGIFFIWAIAPNGVAPFIYFQF
ncbi:MAG: D-alanyl-lipoteichoic acid acyltransferase DltB (MBOAT superfamily) [Parvibaculaceae bacterium]|jgi:alginate O-acetyltransferase complex protein AlgI|nr:MBOAT family protein [Parvibaculaceae bacterium]